MHAGNLPRQTTTQPDRYERLEDAVAQVRLELAEIRQVLNEGLEMFVRQNEARASETAELRQRFEELEENAMLTLFKAFPKQGEFVDEIEAFLRSRRRG